LKHINNGIWLSQGNLRSLYLFRASAEYLCFLRGYIEIFRAYVDRKWPIQAQFAYAITVKPTPFWTYLLYTYFNYSISLREMREEGRMSASRMPVPVFCACANSDDAYCRQLETHLGTFIQQGHITFWHEQKIDPGYDKASAIETHLSEASIILLLISADFLSSDFYIGPVMQLVWQRQQAGLARVIPIVVRPCLWQHSPIGTLQALPTNGCPILLWRYADEAWIQVVTDVQRVIEDPSFLFAPAPHADRAFPSFWDVPYPRNPFFVGRGPVFQMLHKALIPAHISQFTERKNKIENRWSQGDEGLADGGLASPKLEFGCENRYECARGQCPQNIGKSSALWDDWSVC
jgi:hypothetical protein